MQERKHESLTWPPIGARGNPFTYNFSENNRRAIICGRALQRALPLRKAKARLWSLEDRPQSWCAPQASPPLIVRTGASSRVARSLPCLSFLFDAHPRAHLVHRVPMLLHLSPQSPPSSSFPLIVAQAAPLSLGERHRAPASISISPRTQRTPTSRSAVAANDGRAGRRGRVRHMSCAGYVPFSP